MFFLKEKMMQITLKAWTIRHKVTYSRAQKLAKLGKLSGAILNENGKVISIDENYILPQKNLVICAICNRSFPQITGTHLKSHGFTVEEYKNKYPNNKTISSEVIADISQKNSGKIRTEEHKKNLSNSLKGKTAWNKGISGVYTATEETKEKMRISQTGRVHSEETKEKMSKSQLGIKKSPQAIENNRKAQLEYYKNNKGIWNGKKRIPTR